MLSGLMGGWRCQQSFADGFWQNPRRTTRGSVGLWLQQVRFRLWMHDEHVFHTNGLSPRRWCDSNRADDDLATVPSSTFRHMAIPASSPGLLDGAGGKRSDVVTVFSATWLRNSSFPPQGAKCVCMLLPGVTYTVHICGRYRSVTRIILPTSTFWDFLSTKGSSSAYAASASASASASELLQRTAVM
jgi:hypothetical protein